MGAEVTILANPYTYNFLKGLTHSAVDQMPAPEPNLTAPPYEISFPWPDYTSDSQQNIAGQSSDYNSSLSAWNISQTSTNAPQP